MKHRENIEEKIQDLIDGRLQEQEADDLRMEIKNDKYLSLFYATLKEVDGSLHDLDLRHPSDHFTGKVMQSLHKSPARGFDYRSLLVLLGLVICAAVGLVYASQVTLQMPDVTPVSTEVPFAEKYKLTIPGIALPDSELILNVFYFSLLFLALIYLDRVILRQLFKSNKYTT